MFYHADVTLKCENDVMKSVIDRFGEDIRTETVERNGTESYPQK